MNTDEPDTSCTLARLGLPTATLVTEGLHEKWECVWGVEQGQWVGRK